MVLHRAIDIRGIVAGLGDLASQQIEPDGSQGFDQSFVIEPGTVPA
jgi:hypothetical protein